MALQLRREHAAQRGMVRNEKAENFAFPEGQLRHVWRQTTQHPA
jgi:hypothetical protein